MEHKVAYVNRCEPGQSSMINSFAEHFGITYSEMYNFVKAFDGGAYRGPWGQFGHDLRSEFIDEG